MDPLFAQWTIGMDFPIRVLAVVGGFAAAHVLGGWLARLLIKALFRRKLDGWPLWVVRLLSGVLGGWLVALLLFGGGGGGLGGPGGTGFGGTGKGEGVDKESKRPLDKATKPDDKDKDKSDDGAGPGETLVLEVLGEAPLRKLTPKGVVDATRCYRVAGMPARVYGLDEIKALIRQRRAAEPPLSRLEIVVYKDSPDFARPQVAELAAWAREVKNDQGVRLRVDFSEPDRYAPID